MTSLKTEIIQLIRNRGIVNLSAVHELAHSLNYKESNAERQCRHLVEESKIVAIRNSKGWIKEYEFIGEMSNQIKLF